MLAIVVKVSTQPSRFTVSRVGLPTMTVGRDYGARQHQQFAAAARVFAEKHGLSGSYAEGVISSNMHVFVPVCTDPLTFDLEIP